MPYVLLIEDIADNAELVKRVLHSRGYEVVWAETAEAALAQAQSRLPDLVLLDLGLPDIDGQTLMGYLRATPGMEKTPIIAVTAWPEETGRAMMSAYGCDAYIGKPIDVLAFLKTVQSFLPGV